MKTPSIHDSTAACTLISLVSDMLAIASHTSSVAVKGSKQQLLPAYVTAKRKLNGYGIPKLKFSKTDVFDFRADVSDYQVALQGYHRTVSRPILVDKHQSVSATVSEIPSSWVSSSQSHHNWRHNHLNMSQVFGNCSAVGERPALDGPAIFRVTYRDRQEKHLSHSHCWLLIRECSESSCTKCTEAEMESEKEKSPFYIRECGSDLPFCPILCGVQHSVSLQHLNYM